jgi:hypothetical protein
MMTVQEIIDSIDKLSVEDRDYLFESIRKRRIEDRREEILANAQEVMQAFKNGTAMRGSIEDLKLHLLEDDNEE